VHDFDEAREARYHADRQFRIGGEVFTHRPTIRPEHMARYEDMGKDTSATEAMEIIDALIIAWIDTSDDPDAHDRYRALRLREDDPIGGGDLSDVVRWLYRQSTRRPTQEPDLSSDGRESTGTISKETSSTEPAVALAASE
jgi:hypothetical protein